MMRNCKEPRALASLCTLGLILQRDCWDKFAIGSFSSLKVSLHVSPCFSMFLKLEVLHGEPLK